jgi:hypothetical protein
MNDSHRAEFERDGYTILRGKPLLGPALSFIHCARRVGRRGRSASLDQIYGESEIWICSLLTTS